MNPLHLQLGERIPQLFQFDNIHLYRGPMRRQILHPAISFKPFQNPQCVFFVDNLFGLVATLNVLHHRDILFGTPRLVARLRLLVERPAQPGHQTGRANHPHRVLDESVVAYKSKFPVFNVRYAVQGVHQ